MIPRRYRDWSDSVAIDDSPLNCPVPTLPSSGVDIHQSESARHKLVKRIYEKYEAELLGFLRQRFGEGPPEPGDVAQQAFVHIAALEKPQTIENPRAFLYRTAINIAIDHKRRAKRQERILRENFSLFFDEHAADYNPERVILGQDELRRLHEAVESLPERDRVFLILHRLEGVSFAEIARRTGLAASSVRFIVESALKKCQLHLQKQHEDAD